MIKIAVVLTAIAGVTISVLCAHGTSPYDLMNTTQKQYTVYNRL